MADAGAVEQAMMEVASAMGFSELKEKQVEAILALVSGKDVLVSLPTGYGKSVIYGILPLLFNNSKASYNGCTGWLYYGCVFHTAQDLLEALWCVLALSHPS